MSNGSKHEIVIIRRGNHGDHDEHHGGVWKIAFADFMTAMMAFFLVMWLISANDKTRASVARYFNPVKLVDATTQPRGLNDPKKDDSGITASPDTKDSQGKSKEMKKDASGKKTEGAKPEASKSESSKAEETASGREKRLDAALRDNPIAALAEIAGDHGAIDKSKEAPRVGAPVIGRDGGAAFRDPFAPPPAQLASAEPEDEVALGVPPKPSADDRAEPPKAESVRTQSAKRLDRAAADAKQSEAKTPDAKAADLAKQLKSSLTTAGRSEPGPALDVRATKEGLLVSLTDTGSFSMFSNGSAVPSKRIVLMMEGVAKVLASKKGNVVIRGFTDNKQFRTGRYDNWRLSLDRAQTAHYMLVRGGLADERISSVEGLADRAARQGIDPGSPLNRRIEILLREEPK